MKKYSRKHTLLDEVAQEYFPVTESEAKCAITRREHERIRERRIKQPIMRHLFTVEDGLTIRIR